ncbi:MAG: hypothetical protein Q9191_004653 [Dirinaria sp. TL-2023a]
MLSKKLSPFFTTSTRVILTTYVVGFALLCAVEVTNLLPIYKYMGEKVVFHIVDTTFALGTSSFIWLFGCLVKTFLQSMDWPLVLEGDIWVIGFLIVKCSLAGAFGYVVQRFLDSLTWPVVLNVGTRSVTICVFAVYLLAEVFVRLDRICRQTADWAKRFATVLRKAKQICRNLKKYGKGVFLRETHTLKFKYNGIVEAKLEVFLPEVDEVQIQMFDGEAPIVMIKQKTD